MYQRSSDVSIVSLFLHYGFTDCHRHLHNFRRAHQDFYRVEGSEVVLCLPGSAGLPGHLTLFGSRDSRFADLEEPEPSATATCRAPAPRIKLVSYVLRRAGPDERLRQFAELFRRPFVRLLRQIL